MDKELNDLKSEMEKNLTWRRICRTGKGRSAYGKFTNKNELSIQNVDKSTI